MQQPERESFPSEVARTLKTYVYRLIDPRNGETFYVGKGQGNRVFSHIREDQDLEGDDLDNRESASGKYDMPGSRSLMSFIATEWMKRPP